MGVKRSRRVQQKDRQIAAARDNRGAEWRVRQDERKRCPMCTRLGSLVCTHPNGDRP